MQMDHANSSGGPQDTTQSMNRRGQRVPRLNLPDGDHDWKRHYALPTPLHSPSNIRQRSNHNISYTNSQRQHHQRQRQNDESHGLTLSWKERIRHFTWTWFCMSMATGQIANVLYKVPWRFPGLYALGCIVFLFNIVLFLFNVTMISLRFKYYPSTFMSSMRHPTESLFIPAAVISLGTILMNITEYGTTNGKTGPWLEDVMVVLFWIYCGLAMCFTCGIYLVMWSTQTFTISQMTPVWIFPAYPLLVIGPHAGVLAERILGTRALDVIIGGFTLQGIGFMVSLMVYAAFLYRLMTNKLPAESLRPGMFISVGPSGFTISGVINMGQTLPKVIPADFMGVGPIAGTITMVIANWMGIWLWGLALFFLIVSVGAHYSCLGHGKMHFAMTWYSFVFPNTGLTTATFAVGKALDNTPIKILGCVFTVILIFVWFFVFGMMIRAVIHKQILWPQKQEDRDEDLGSSAWHGDKEDDIETPSSPEKQSDSEDSGGVLTRNGVGARSRSGGGGLEHGDYETNLEPEIRAVEEV